MSLPGTKNSTDIGLQDELTYSSSFLPSFLLRLAEPVLRRLSPWHLSCLDYEYWWAKGFRDMQQFAFSSSLI